MSRTANDNDFYNYLISEYNHPFSGWDFSYLEKRWLHRDSGETWDYTARVKAAMQQAQSMLDIDTGGGERLASLQPLPPETCATESYAPNIPVARQRLEPLSVKVYEVQDKQHMPFADEQFDLIINRHGSYYPPEIKRMLKPGKQLITQQVDGRTGEELNKLFEVPYTYPNWRLNIAVKELQTEGFQILEQREEFPITRFYDVGAIVYYLKAIPWQVQGFSVEQYFDKLVVLNEQIQVDGSFVMHSPFFFIVAQKP